MRLQSSAWDLTDEPPFWIVDNQTTDSMAINWTRLIVDGIRKYDKLHPIVVGTSGQEIEPRTVSRRRDCRIRRLLQRPSFHALYA